VPTFGREPTFGSMILLIIAGLLMLWSRPRRLTTLDDYSRFLLYAELVERALKDKKSFGKWTLPPPFQSTKDVFCIRMNRMVNAYRKISISNLDLTVPKAPLHEEVEIRLFLDEETDLVEVRFWYEKKLLGTQRVKKN